MILTSTCKEWLVWGHEATTQPPCPLFSLNLHSFQSPALQGVEIAGYFSSLGKWQFTAFDYYQSETALELKEKEEKSSTSSFSTSRYGHKPVPLNS